MFDGREKVKSLKIERTIRECSDLWQTFGAIKGGKTSVSFVDRGGLADPANSRRWALLRASFGVLFAYLSLIRERAVPKQKADL